ncbi:MAG TPA: hypothetical protein VJ979_13805 [Actinomycetota bacterium]|nr:hypothetical protein [Actinomycetota bacterium]
MGPGLDQAGHLEHSDLADVLTPLRPQTAQTRSVAEPTGERTP